MDEIISVYTRQQAIADGVLLRLDEWLAQDSAGAILMVVLRQANQHGGRFRLGEVVITANAARVLEPLDVFMVLLRHQFGDWGELDEVDLQRNDAALEQTDRLLSSYRTKQLEKLWVITEWNREATTVMLPEDY